ncbi:MAG: DUF2723 domain-containing protein [Bacteroidales bacterium]|jgi:hypothetical protein|nr:DUF2723 domain-containing protein [Bacteroidales bacterium]
MKKYNLINNIIGWGIFLVAAIVYLLTAEPTASWWDCGEYIATTAKLEVGHPPGAPTFQILGRLFAMLFGDSPTTTAFAVNAMSAISSAFTILFLFWSITMLAKKFVKNVEEMTSAQTIAVFGSGIVGALAYTFSDTFWYSAVEGEVYAMSSFFTAVTFWAILKWESQADDKHNLRWLILISFLIGIAIGVHLLNLLTIPAIVYVFYYKKYKTTKKGLFWAGAVSIIIVAFVMYLLIPWIIKFASKFEIFFVNSIGMPFNSGTIIFILLIIGLIVWGLLYSKRKEKPILNTIVLSFLFFLIGYSTFATIIIRANANTPINENAPKDALSLLSYFNRDQYGSSPLFYGEYYNAPFERYKEGNSKYIKDTANGKYIEVKQQGDPVWKGDYCTLFPRMYSHDPSRPHIPYYKLFTGINGDRKPTFTENLTYFFRYQVNHMYWRYFLWNFAGRQNDIQNYGLNYDGSNPENPSNGTKDVLHGNWITGIDFIDAWRLGPQDNLPPDLANNKAKNRLFCLPLLLGIAGLIFHIKRRKKDAFVVFLLFFMTGLAIVVYLNQPPAQPRERDYAYAGSFYAFAIWIGLGVYALFDWLRKVKLNENAKAIAVSLICLIAVPVLMASQEWDDHDRSIRYMTRDIAKDYLESCDKDAILFVFGDNDTFPLWYAQEVEGIRPDVRIVNVTLAGMSWYVEQLYNKVYDADKIKFTLPKRYYGLGSDVTLLFPSVQPMNGTDVLKKIAARFDMNSEFMDSINYLTGNQWIIPFDKAKMAAKGIYPKELVDGEQGKFEFTIPVGDYGYKQLPRNDLMVLDMIATNGFERPMYIMSPNQFKGFIPNLTEYMRQDGLLYRIVPYRANMNINTDVTYDKFMNQFKWGNVNHKDYYLEDAVSMNNAVMMRQFHSLLARTLISEGKNAKAINVLNKAVKEFPFSNVTIGNSDMLLATAYCEAGDKQKGEEIYTAMFNHYLAHYNYYKQFKGKLARSVEGDKIMQLQMLSYVLEEASKHGITSLQSRKASIPELSAIDQLQEARMLYNDIVNEINQAASLARENRKDESGKAFIAALDKVEQMLKLSGNDSDLQQRTQQLLTFVLQNAQQHQLPSVLTKIQNNQVLSSLASSGQVQ